MHDIFLSYANVDRLRVRPLVEMLQQHWPVWWDRSIPPGKTFDQVIEEQLEAARCVIVVWSRASVGSDWVKEEAEEGRQRGILVPVVIDEQVRPPLGFRRLQAAQLFDWQPTVPHAEFDLLMQAITALLGPPTPPPVQAPTINVLLPRQSSHDLPCPRLSQIRSGWSLC